MRLTINTRPNPFLIPLHVDAPALQPKRAVGARDETDADPSPTPRKVQRRVPWTDAEKKAIIDGMLRFGQGRWSEILELHADVFAVNKRDVGGIRDQYRTMVTNGDAADRLLRAAREDGREDDALGTPVAETPQAPTRYLAHPTPSPTYDVTYDVPATVAPAPAVQPSSFTEPLARRNTGRADTWSPHDVETLINGVTDRGRNWTEILAIFRFTKQYTHIQLNEKWKTLKKWEGRRHQLSPEERDLLDRVQAADKAQQAKQDYHRAKVMEANKQKAKEVVAARQLQRLEEKEKQKRAEAAPLDNNMLAILSRVDPTPQQALCRVTEAPFSSPEQQRQHQLHPPHDISFPPATDRYPKSDYHGVSWVAKRSKWRMRLYTRDKTVVAEKLFASEHDAARAYNTALKDAMDKGFNFANATPNVIEADTKPKGKPSSTFKGVVVLGGKKRPRTFRGQLTFNNKAIKSDPFTSEEAAARWYDEQRVKRGLERVNFVQQVANFDMNLRPIPAPAASAPAPLAAPEQVPALAPAIGTGLTATPAVDDDDDDDSERVPDSDDGDEDDDERAKR